MFSCLQKKAPFKALRRHSDEAPRSPTPMGHGACQASVMPPEVLQEQEPPPLEGWLSKQSLGHPH